MHAIDLRGEVGDQLLQLSEESLFILDEGKLSDVIFLRRLTRSFRRGIAFIHHRLFFLAEHGMLQILLVTLHGLDELLCE